MKKILHVAWREFASTVFTKGFLLGIFLTPAIVGVMLVLLPLLVDQSPPEIDGEVVVVDPTGEITQRMQEWFEPEAVAARRDEVTEAIKNEIPENLQILAEGQEEEMEQILGSVPDIQVTEMDPNTVDLEAEKKPLLEGTAQDGGRLAIAVVHDNAVAANSEGKFGSYDLYIREKLDDRIIGEIKDAVREGIVEARVRSEGLDPEEISALTHVSRVKPRTVTAEGEKENTEILNILLPAAFMVLLLISTLTGGQYLMTTTIEEKSSRVVELLLSAVSPMELMTGKILGQLAVGLMILGLYGGMGMAALVSFSMMGLLDPMLIVYLVIFYLIAYFVMGAMMAAIGAAVNEMREAQTLMMPVMMIVMIPWMLWMPITRDPNSLFATVASLLPPITPYVMLLRLTSTTPPPFWQVMLSIVLGLISVYVALWMAAKVFRIGILLHGKPPSLKTLIRWLRMA